MAKAEIIGRYNTDNVSGFLPDGRTPVAGDLVRVKDDMGIGGSEREYIELINCGRSLPCPALGGNDNSICYVILYRKTGMNPQDRTKLKINKSCGQRLLRRTIRLTESTDKLIPVEPLPSS